MQDLSGRQIKGYELHDMIGAGGFGAVYRAFQPVIKRDVAMKIILPEHANHPEFIRRFEFEAQLVARLEHIHIVPLYDYWREPDGAYLVMRWLRGGSLRGLLKEGPIEIDLAVRIVEQVSAALAVAHRRGVVHRDIKPDNILFDEDYNAFLADFGIAKDLREPAVDDEGNDIDDSATLTGSPFYLSPEQAQSQPVSPVSDIYSLGIVMYEVLTGHPPFSGERGLMGILLNHINDPTPSLLDRRPDLPPAADVVIQRATAKDPQSRYTDALSLAIDFRRALTGVEATETDMQMIHVGTDTDMDDLLVITKPLSPSTLIIIPGEDVANPYKGLQPFEEADAEDFFGRTALIETLLERMQEPGDISRFLAVIGPSGSGKSSAVKAGLIPALRKGALPGSERWYMVEMVPGHDPFLALSSALLGVAVDPPADLLERLRTDDRALVTAIDEILPEDTNAELVLTIDQFEETFTLLDDEAARAHFLNLLLMAIAEPSCRIRLIVTLRADFYDRPLLYPGFGEMVRRRNEVVLPLSPDEMREAIVSPAKRAGLTVETGLVAAIVAEIAEQPGALPLMQYALTEVFERREGITLTLDAYHASGGVLGALARRAEELYESTEPAKQEAMQQMFLRLVTLGEGTEDTRRRAQQAELMAVADDENMVNDVLDLLGKYRLLTFDHDPDTRAPIVSVAHEALIREWRRLRGWLDDNREDILLQRRVADATEQWHKQNRDASFLASGMRLQQFEPLLERGTVALTPDEVAYVQASIAEGERQAAEKAAQEARERELERRAKARLRMIVAVVSVAAIIAAILAVLALASRQEAQDQRKNADQQRSTAQYNAEVAEEQRDIAESLALVANAQMVFSEKNRDLAIALALKAVEIDDPPTEAQLMLGKAAFSPGARAIFDDHGTYVFGAVFSPDGTRFASASYDQMVFLWDAATGDVIYQFEGHNIDDGERRWVRALTYCQDGDTILSGDQFGLTLLWRVADGEIIQRLEGEHQGPVRGVACSPDGTTAITVSDDWTGVVWDLETGSMIHRLGVVEDEQDPANPVGHQERVLRVVYSPDGKTAATSSYDSTIRLWDVATGEEIRQFTGTKENLVTVAFSPDGTMLLSGGSDRAIRIWDVATGEEIRQLQGHDSWVKSVRFTQDQRVILSSSDDGTVRLWNAETGDEIERFEGHTGQVEQAEFNPDETQVLSASLDGTLRLWDLTNGAEVGRLLGGNTDRVITVDISADGTRAVTGGADSMVYIWDMATRQKIGSFDGHIETGRAIEPLLISPDGVLVASGAPSANDVVLVWNIETGEIVWELIGHDNTVNSAAFSPDGQKLVTVSQDYFFKVWDMATGEEIHTSEEFESTLRGAAFSPDGALVAISTSSPDNMVALYDTTSWEQVKTLDGHTSAVNEVRFSPDGTRIVTGSDDYTARLWDAASGDEIRRMSGHTAGVSRVVFSPDGNTIASSSEDGTVRLWDVATGQTIRQFDNDLYAVNGLAYNPDGLTVLSGAADATLRLWDATPLTLERLVNWTYTNRYIPELTCSQREQFRVEPTCDAEGIYPTSTPYTP
ncbi:MAG: protein kinase [Anaerolineae bacterium]|nr:protein kinase [Anaerolineae bacterium]